MQAVLATLPWCDFARIFEKTHLVFFDIARWPSTFSNFCWILQREMRKMDYGKIMDISVDQAFELLGNAVYADVQTAEGLETATMTINHMSRILFMWKYRYLTYRAAFYRHEERSSSIVVGVYMARCMANITGKHPTYRRASLNVELASLVQRVENIMINAPGNHVNASACRTSISSQTQRYGNIPYFLSEEVEFDQCP